MLGALGFLRARSVNDALSFGSWFRIASLFRQACAVSRATFAATVLAASGSDSGSQCDLIPTFRFERFCGLLRFYREAHLE